MRVKTWRRMDSCSCFPVFCLLSGIVVYIVPRVWKSKRCKLCPDPWVMTFTTLLYLVNETSVTTTGSMCSSFLDHRSCIQVMNFSSLTISPGTSFPSYRKRWNPNIGLYFFFISYTRSWSKGRVQEKRIRKCFIQAMDSSLDISLQTETVVYWIKYWRIRNAFTGLRKDNAITGS